MSAEIDDSSFCPVCFDVYEEYGHLIPRILPCSHTLCHKCVEELLNNYTLVCPQDRQVHPAFQGAKSFPQNKYILKYLQKDTKGIDTQFEI